MPLTRHLYKEDEVAASLALCCLQGRVQEASFWCLELIDSGLIDQLLLVLRRTWLFGYGGGAGAAAAQWILKFEDSVKGDALDADVLLRWTMELARLGAGRKRDCSVAVLVALTWKELAATPPALSLDQAVAQGKGLVAWDLLRRVVAAEGMETAWAACRRLATKKHKGGAAGTGLEPFCEQWLTCVWGLEDVGDWSKLAAGVSFLYATTQDLEGGNVVWTCQTNGPDLTQWRAQLGHRARRVFTIHPDAIGWLTERGRRLTVYETNEKELLRLERPTGLWGSQVWDEYAEEVGGWEAIRNDAETREAFYDRFFPDDIPDEWSTAERGKSHGAGVLQKGGKPDPVRWFRNWFGTAACVAGADGPRLAMAALGAGGCVEAEDGWNGRV